MAKILIVDDCPLVSPPLCLLLDRTGHQSTCVADPADPLAALQSTGAALILLEVATSAGGDALAFLRALRANPDRRVAATPVVIWSTLDDTESVDRATSAGADGYLVKGLPFETIEDRLAPFLARPPLTAGATIPVPAP